MAASKKTRKWRSKERIILAIKKQLYEDKLIARRWKKKEFIGKEVRRQGERKFIGATFIRECRKENKEIIKEITELAKNKAVIIGGDYNVRTWEEVRCVVYEYSIYTRV